MKEKTKVWIDEAPPPVERIVHDPKAVQGVIKQLERLLEARNNRRRANKTGRNKSQQQDAQQLKSTVLEIRDCLIRQYPMLRLPRKTNELAKRIQTRLPKGKPLTTRHIRRLLTGK
jgi:hypothetical protein